MITFGGAAPDMATQAELDAVAGAKAPLNLPVRSVSTNTTAVVGELLKVDATGGGRTITPPSSPATGARFRVTKSDASANVVLVTGTVNGDTGGAQITTQYTAATFIYDGSGWLLESANSTAAPAELAAVAALTPSNDDLVQRKAGAWTNRTPAQVAADLPVSTAQQTAIAAAVPTLNVKNYGAKGDSRQVTVSTTSGSTSLTGTGFTSADTGKRIGVPGAGASGAPLVTTVTYVSATELTLGTAASTAVTSVLADLGTDDSAAIQATITAASSSGRAVYIPAGTYLLGSALTLNTSNLHLAGDKRLTVLKGVFTSGQAYILWNSNFATTAIQNVSLSDLTVDRSGANSQHGMHFRNVDRLTIDRVDVIGFPSVLSGAIIIGGFVTGQAENLCTNVQVTRCYFKSTDNFAVQFGTVQRGVISSCVADDAYREVFGVEPSSGQTSSDVVIANNVVRQGSSKYPSSSETGCIIATGTSGGTLSNVAITGNVVHGGAVIASDSSPGILVVACNGVAVTGNSVESMNGSGIQIGTGGNTTTLVSVTGNVVRNCNQASNATPGGSGIQLRGATRCSVKDNIVSGTLHTCGVEENNSAASNHVTGNVLYDNVSPFGTFGANSVYNFNKRNPATGSDDIYTSLSFIDGRNIGLGGTTGTQIATGPTQKIGFWGATPVVRPTGTPAAATDAATTQALVNDLRSKLISLGLIS